MLPDPGAFQARWHHDVSTMHLAKSLTMRAPDHLVAGGGPGTSRSARACQAVVRWQWLVVGLLVLSCIHPAYAKRVALLVANHSYEVGRLTYPPQDVAVMRKALIEIGFDARDIVTVTDADRRALSLAIQDLGRRAAGAQVSLLYYSGHATQARGQNWLVPIGASIQTEAGYEIEAVSAQAAVAQLEAANPAVSIVILDACRDNPLAFSKTATKGLTRMTVGDRTLLAYATAPYRTANDNGLYAKVLAAQLVRPGLELLEVFRNTSAEVRRITQGAQVPRVSEVSLDKPVYLAGPPGPTRQEVERQAWEIARRSDTVASYDAYLAEYPQGVFATAARVARAAARATSPSPATPAAAEAVSLQVQVPTVRRQSMRRGRMQTPQPWTGRTRFPARGLPRTLALPISPSCRSCS